MAICKLHCLDHVTNIFLHDIRNRPYVLDFLGSYNVLFLLHFEYMYQQMKLLGCIQVPNRCRTNSNKFKHPHIKLWIFGVHSNGQ
jgi:hypothetical protein